MESLALGLKIFSIFTFLMLAIGLFKPWIVLWWEDIQNRLKVIKIYGVGGILTWLLSKLIYYLSA